MPLRCAIFIELYRRRRDETFLNLALELVDQVHFVLGRHREDDHRRSWISGLSDEEFKHPTIGLRIGKPLPERRPDEPFNEALGWERDDQYYHYPVKWMHALNRTSLITGDLKYKVWAIELAKTLSRPLVTSRGLHDPLDGLVTYLKLWSDAPRNVGLSLEREIGELDEYAGIWTGRPTTRLEPADYYGTLTPQPSLSLEVITKT